MKTKHKLLLTPEHFKPSFPDWKIQGVLNPAGVRIKNKKIVLYVRVAEAPNYGGKSPSKCPVIITNKEYEKSPVKSNKRKLLLKKSLSLYLKDSECKLLSVSHFKRVVLDETGFEITKLENTIAFAGMPEYSEYGVEDPHITKIKNTYLMTYVAISLKNGISTYLATSKDLLKWQRKGTIFREQNKDVVIFPEKINGKYVALNRPETTMISKPGIWISYSPDLVHWGDEKALLRARKNSWESERNGAGAPPIKTDKGWLLIYHGVCDKKRKGIYSAGAALLDLKNPEKILARTPKNKPLLIPQEDCEKKGFTNNVVFPTAAIPDLNGKDVLIYAGGADSVITVKKIAIDDILKSLEQKD